MRLSKAERKRARQMAGYSAPVVTVDADGPDFPLYEVLLLSEEAGATIRHFGSERGKHLNSLGWRMARRFGWRVAAVA